MLYDNAQLARLYLRAAALLSREDYKQVAKDTLQFMQRELMVKEGAMVASLSAIDNKNVEGGYYLWTRKDLSALLTAKEQELVESSWLGKAAAAFDAGYLPIWQGGYEMKKNLTVNEQKLLNSAKQKLLGKRQKDRLLPVDDKLLAGWNGLALSAFSRAASKYNDPEFRKTADSIAQYISGTLWQQDHLIRARKAGKEMGSASLADYAYVAEGLWDYYQLTKNKQDLSLLQAVINTAWKKFYTTSGWSPGRVNALESTGRQGVIPDGPQASSSSTLLLASYKLALETGDQKLKEKVQTALGYNALSMSSNAFWYATQVRVINQVYSPASEKP
jgi:uncharacterized protein YyaL (SSP411 family)